MPIKNYNPIFSLNILVASNLIISSVAPEPKSSIDNLIL